MKSFSFFTSHIPIVRAAAPLGRHPVDDLVGIHDVAGLAVDAVGKVDLKPPLLFSGVNHLIHIRRTEILARVAVLFDATANADIEVENFKVRGLVFVVMCARVINIRELVERELIVVLWSGIAIMPAIRLELPHMLMASLDREPRRKATSCHDRNSFSHQAEQSPPIERLMEVASLVELAADIALFEVLVEGAKRVSSEIILDQRVENR